MFIKKQGEGNSLIRMSDAERNALINSINFIIDDLGEDELSTRTGFSIEQYQDIRQLIQNVNSITLDTEQLRMLDEALNEVGQGIFIPEFEKEIGLPHDDIMQMLACLEEQFNSHRNDSQ